MTDPKCVGLIRAAIATSNLDGLKHVYQTYGDDTVDQWMTDNHGYYKLRLNGNKACIKYIETKWKDKPERLIITDDMLVPSMQAGNVASIRVAAECELLQALLPNLVTTPHLKTIVLLRYSQKFGVKFTDVDCQGNTMMHLLACVPAPTIQSAASYQPIPDAAHDCFRWIIAFLQGNGLSLSTKNNELKTPVDLATEQNNIVFLEASGQISANPDVEENMFPNCLLL